MLEPVLYIGIAQSIFGGIVIAVRKPQMPADRILSAWLFLIAIEMILALVKLNWLDHLPYEIPFLVLPLTYGPFLYLYVRTLIARNPRSRWIDLVHFAPFILFLGLAFLFRTDVGLDSRLPVWANPGKMAKVIYEILVFSSFTTYSIIAYILLTRHRKAILEEFSYRSGRITLTWLLFLSITVYASYALTFLSAGVQMLVIHLPFDPKIFSFTGLTLVSIAFSFYGHQQSGIYHGRKPIALEANDDEGAGKYAKSGLSREELKAITDALRKLMEKEKLFIDPELTLADVSSKLSIPRHHLTQAINTELNKNFFTYINELRVGLFMIRIVQKKFRHYTILALAYDCGFNSKSTFNSVFKKVTGFTPTEYINSLSI
ncbi:MAG: AraC family transcriptional regulator [Bacteroidales bacterium]